MNPKYLIEAAYSANIPERDKEETFRNLVKETEALYADQDERFRMTPEDFNIVYTI